jgi:peptidoglycan hydrolase-like protein with peptidoglycan-binding domain
VNEELSEKDTLADNNTEEAITKTIKLDTENNVKDKFIEDNKVTENKTFKRRTIKCYTYVNSNIKLNSSKNIKSEVEKLEKFLNKYYKESLAVNGIFEESDKEALKRFQEKNNLEVDGILGPKTLKILNAIYCVKNEK